MELWQKHKYLFVFFHRNSVKLRATAEKITVIFS